MDDEVISIDRIQAEARRAAREGLSLLQGCRHSLGSPGARVWQIEYAKELGRIHAESERVYRSDSRQE